MATEKTKSAAAATTKSTPADSAMTAADAAALVHRMVAKRDAKGQVVLDKDNNPVGVEQAVEPEDVMSFADYGDHVVVVTTDGQKLRGDK